MELSDWEALLAEEPDNELVRFTVAKKRFDLRDFATACSHFAKLVDQDPENIMIYTLWARAELELGHRDEAKRIAEMGLPIAIRQKHEDPQSELESILQELNQEF
jgi:predicted Zn-dependent protease